MTKPELSLSVEVKLPPIVSAGPWSQGPGFAIKPLFAYGKIYSIFAPDWMLDNQEELIDFIEFQISAAVFRAQTEYDKLNSGKVL